MGRKSKTFNLVFTFMKAGVNPDHHGQDHSVEMSYLIDQQGDEVGITYRNVKEHEKEFIKATGLPRELHLTYLAPDNTVKMVGSKFQLDFCEWEDSYDGTFVIMAQSQLQYLSKRLQGLSEYMDKLFDQLQETKKNF